MEIKLYARISSSQKNSVHETKIILQDQRYKLSLMLSKFEILEQRERTLRSENILLNWNNVKNAIKIARHSFEKNLFFSFFILF